MATYQKRTNANGQIKIKAIARCWVNGRQRNRTRSFNIEDKHLAEQWAESIEERMQIAKAEMKLASHDKKQNIQTIFLNTLLDNRINTMERLRAALPSNISLLTISTTTLIDFFKQRAKQQATMKQIQEEIVMLKSLMTEHTEEGQPKRGNMVQAAYDASICDGIFFN